MADMETAFYIRKAQAFLAATERQPNDPTELALQDWLRAQSLDKPERFVVQIGRAHGSGLWGILSVDLVSSHREFYASRPTLNCIIPLHEGTRIYQDHEMGIPWMAKANRNSLLKLDAGAHPQEVDAGVAYEAMGLFHDEHYGPFHASTSGGGQGDMSLHISEADWSVFPESFIHAFAASQGASHALARSNLFVAAALFGSLKLEETLPLSIVAADRTDLVRADAPNFAI